VVGYAHSVADYLDEFEPVKVTFAKPLTHILRLDIPLDPNIIDKLYTHAQKKGVELTTLIRMWILEDLEKLEKQQPEGVPAFSLPWVGGEIHPLPHSTLVQLPFLEEYRDFIHR
jgi:hypothetical protein